MTLRSAPAARARVVQHRRGHQPCRVASVTEHGAVLSNLGGEVPRPPLAVLVPDRVEVEVATGRGRAVSITWGSGRQRVCRFCCGPGKGLRLWHAKRPFT